MHLKAPILIHSFETNLFMQDSPVRCIHLIHVMYEMLNSSKNPFLLFIFILKTFA